MPITDDQARAAIIKGTDAINARRVRKMIAGRLDTSGAETLSGAPAGTTYVRSSPESREQTVAYGSASPAGAPVKVIEDYDGSLYIQSPDWVEAVKRMGDAAKTITVVRGYDEVIPKNIDANGFKPGRLGASETGTTYVHVEPFEYNGARYAPTDTDVAAYYPAADSYGRIGCYFNPSTEALVFFAGSNDTDLAQLIQIDDRADVPAGTVPLGAVLVSSDSSGDPVDIGNTNIFESWRVFVQPFGHLLTGNAVTRTIASGVLTIGSESRVAINGEGDANDTLVTATITGAARVIWIIAASGLTITVDTGADNINTASGSDSDIYDTLWIPCLWDGTSLTVRDGGGGGSSPLTTKGDIYVYGSSDTRLPVGTDGQVIFADSAATEGVAWGDLPTPSGGAGDYILIRDEKSSGTHGGTFTSGAWRTRDLNTEVVDTGSHASVASNQITLAAGTYRADIFAPGNGVTGHRARLQNITDGTTVLLGSSAYAPNTSPSGLSYSVVKGRFTIASTKTLEVQHYCSSTFSTYGFGVALGDGTNEIYTIVELTRE